MPVSQVFGYWDNLGKLGLNSPNHAQRDMKSNPKTSVPYLTSNEVLLLCEGHLRVDLYQLDVYICPAISVGAGALGQFGEIGPKYSQII